MIKVFFSPYPSSAVGVLTFFQPYNYLLTVYLKLYNFDQIVKTNFHHDSVFVTQFQLTPWPGNQRSPKAFQLGKSLSSNWAWYYAELRGRKKTETWPFLQGP